MNDAIQNLQIGFLIYPNCTPLDFIGPAQAFSLIPGATVRLVWKTLEPVPMDIGFNVTPTNTLEDCPALDVLCVPGGMSTGDYIHDEDLIQFLQRQGAQAEYVTSVCSGSYLLGSAGLLDGYKATSHWTVRDGLSAFGAIPTTGRVIKDRNRITGGGVTAGVDFGLQVVAELGGEELAKFIQLAMEYDPAPPFDSGSPDKASEQATEAIRNMMAPGMEALIL